MLLAAAGPAVAQEDDSPSDLDTVIDDAIAEGEEAEGEEADEEASPEADAESAEDWENPMRNRISPVMNNEGAMGFHGHASAISPGELMFQVGLLAEASGGSNVIRYNDQNRSFGGNVLVNGSITENFGFNFGLKARNNVNDYGRPQAMLAQGDMNLGLIGRHMVSPGVWLGGDLNLYIPSSFGGVGLAASSTSVRPRLLASLDIDEMMGAADDLVVPVVAHINLGLRFDNSESLVEEGTRLDRIERFAYGISAYNMVELGVGAEFPLPYITPFLGWSLGIPVAGDDELCGPNRALECVGDVGASAFPQKLSLGAKGEPLQNLGLHLGIDIGLTSNDAEGLPVTLPYNMIFGVSWNIDTHPVIQIEETEVEKIVEVDDPRGHLLGRVLDRNTGEPVRDARVAYLYRDDSGHFSGDSGIFRSYDFEPGEELEFEIDHPYYEATTASWVVEEGTHELEIMMEPVPLEATVRGRIELPEDEEVGEPTVTLTARDGMAYEVTLDEEGYFEQKVVSGAFTVSAILEGYLTVGKDFEVAPDSEVDVDLSFSALEGDIVVGVAETQIRVQDRIEFQSGESILLDQSREVLDVVAAVLFENPQAQKVQIQGHTDDAGDEDYNLQLSQNRADVVRDYLIERGVSPERLDAEGYGSSNPLVPNTSRRNRNLNRRIEFRVTE